MAEFRVTFGQQYARDAHPRLPGIAHPDGWLTIVADDKDRARELTVALLGRFWSDLYAMDDSGSMDDPGWTVLYPRGELLRMVDSPQIVVEPLRFVGTDPGNTDTEMLFTLWPDGRADVAWRDTSLPIATWGPPHPLRGTP